MRGAHGPVVTEVERNRSATVAVRRRESQAAATAKTEVLPALERDRRIRRGFWGVWLGRSVASRQKEEEYVFYGWNSDATFATAGACTPVATATIATIV